MQIWFLFLYGIDSDPQILHQVCCLPAHGFHPAHSLLWNGLMDFWPSKDETVVGYQGRMSWRKLARARRKATRTCHRAGGHVWPRRQTYFCKSFVYVTKLMMDYTRLWQKICIPISSALSILSLAFSEFSRWQSFTSVLPRPTWIWIITVLIVEAVLFKFKPAVTAVQRAEFVKNAKSLKSLSCVKDGRLIVGGPSITNPISKTQGYDCALVSYHEDLEAVEEYHVTKEHERSVNCCVLGSICISGIVECSADTGKKGLKLHMYFRWQKVWSDLISRLIRKTRAWLGCCLYSEV